MKYVIYCAHTNHGDMVNITHNPYIDYEFIKRSYDIYGFEVISPEIDISQANYILRGISKNRNTVRSLLFHGGRRTDNMKADLIRLAMDDLGIKPLKKTWHVAKGEWVDQSSMNSVHSLLKGRIMDYYELKDIIDKRHIFVEGNIFDILQALYLERRINILPALWIEKPNRTFTCMVCETDFHDYGYSEYVVCPFCKNSVEPEEVLYTCAFDDGEKMRAHIKFKDTRNFGIYQDRASYRLISFLSEDKDCCLLWTVPGSEDINMPFRAVRDVLSKGGKVGFAVECGIDGEEMAASVNDAFPGLGCRFNEGLDLDISLSATVMTFRDIKRCAGVFDLLVVWEKEGCRGGGINPMSRQVKRALRDGGKVIYMTSTPGNYLYDLAQKGEIKLVAVPLRAHGRPSPEPRIMTYKTLSEENLFIPRGILDFIIWSARERRQVRILVPYPRLIGMIFNDLLISDEIEDEWIKGEKPIILVNAYSKGEITQDEANIIVFFADERKVFDEKCLLFAAGLCGRSESNPGGEVIFVGSRESEEMENAKNMMRFLNKCAWEMGYLK